MGADAQRPFLAGFGPCFLLWELSTPLLNAHWFMVSTSYFHPAYDIQHDLRTNQEILEASDPIGQDTGPS